jgi:F-type H+-transporting ATPase subunit epsilon
MTKAMQLEILTPDRTVLDKSVHAMRVLLPDGWWGILPGHTPMISYLHDGIVHYTIDETRRYVALYQGTIEVQIQPGGHTRVLILTSAAEEGDDLEKVQASLELQAEKLAELAREANREFNQLRLSLEKSLQQAEITETGLR